MRMQIGEFYQQPDGSLQGKIQMLGLGVINVATMDAASKTDGSPYLKFMADPSGEPYQIGVGFPKSNGTLNYYRLSFDSPMFPETINAALLPDRDNKKIFNLVWNRAPAAQPGPDAKAGTNNEAEPSAQAELQMDQPAPKKTRGKTVSMTP